MTRYRITAADQSDGAPPFVIQGVGVDTVYAESDAALELWLAEAEEAGLVGVKWEAVGDLYRRRPIEVRAIRWTGRNEAEVRALCSGFYAIDEEDRANCDDPDATAEGPVGPHGNRGLLFDGDWIVAWPDGKFERKTDAAFRAEFEEVAL